MLLSARTLSLATLASILMATSALAQSHTITGDIAYRERIALPETAIATVSLIDVSLADAPAVTLAEQVIDPAGQVPIRFVLDVDESAIEDGRSYAISARIEVEGELWFINDTRIAVDPLNQTEPVAVALVSARSGDAPSGGDDAEAGEDTTAMPADLAGTTWLLTTLGENQAADDVDTTLTFNAEDGGVGGNGGCNSYGGTITFEEAGTFDISEVFSTMMACAEPAMSQERDFFAALDAAATYGLEGETLTLLDAEDNGVATLVANPQETGAVLPDLSGSQWRATMLGGEAVADGVETTLEFDTDGTAGGNSGCNGYGGPVTLGEDGLIAMGDFVATQRGCADPIGAQERALFDAYTNAARYETDGATLSLLDGSGAVLAEFIRVE